MKRDEILDKSKELINGQRAKDYGDAFENHSRIANGWNIIMNGALISHGYLTEQHVILMMDWVKTARLLQTISHEDSWLDKVGYSALGGEFSGKSEELDNLGIDSDMLREVEAVKRKMNKKDG